MLRIDGLRRLALGLTILMSALPRETHAQPLLQFSAVQGLTDEGDLGTPLGLRVTAGASVITVSVEHVRDHQARHVSYCFGFIGPDSDCTSRPSDIDAHLTSVLLGISTGPSRVSARLEFGLAWLNADWQSRATEHHVDASRGYFTAGATGELRHVLQPERLNLVAGASVRALFARRGDRCADCAVFYQNDFGTLGLSLGVEFREKPK